MGFEQLSTLVVIGTDYIGSYKSNYHTIMTTTTPFWYLVFPDDLFGALYMSIYFHIIDDNCKKKFFSTRKVNFA